MSAQREPVECCICMDAINFATNNCVTPCGHTFCFQCLAKALEQNNTCPCCRAVLMAEPEDEDDDSVWSEYTDEDEEDDTYGDDALSSLRMLYQRLDGEEVEDEAVEDDEEVSNADENESVVDDEEDEDNEPLAEVEEITAKLQSRGITMLDLVAMLTDRKSTKVAKHTDRFINALDSILDNAITDCDREAKEAAQRQIEPVAEEAKEIA
jgi:hypothetical protein